MLLESAKDKDVPGWADLVTLASSVIFYVLRVSLSSPDGRTEKIHALSVYTLLPFSSSVYMRCMMDNEDLATSSLASRNFCIDTQVTCSDHNSLRSLQL